MANFGPNDTPLTTARKALLLSTLLDESAVLADEIQTDEMSLSSRDLVAHLRLVLQSITPPARSVMAEAMLELQKPQEPPRPAGQPKPAAGS